MQSWQGAAARLPRLGQRPPEPGGAAGAPAAEAAGRSPHVRRIPRFAAVGVTGFAVNSVLLLVLHGLLHAPLLPAAAAATEAAILCNFALNDAWTFRDAARALPRWRRAVRYNGVALGGLAISLSVLTAITALAGDGAYLLANVAGVVSATGWNCVVGSRRAWSGSGSTVLPLRRLAGEGGLVLTLSFLLYLGLAAWLVLKVGLLAGDGISRTANAYYVLFSRDPHLAAVGFVWNPLPSLVQIPLLLFKDVWPALATRGFAGDIQSAAFMAGAAYQLNRALAELGTRRVPRVLITLLFALDPMVMFYGWDGMSEASLLFAMLMTARHLARWAREGELRWLVLSGVGLAIGYTTRYETAAAALGVTLFVVGLTLWRGGETWRRRAWNALADAVAVASPFALVFTGWAAASWILVGAPFAQFSSVYGNSSQVSMEQATHPPLLTGAVQALGQMEHMEPLWLVVLVLAAIVGVLRRDAAIPAIASVFCSVLAFMFLTRVTGMILPWFRYFIELVPMVGLLLGAVWSDPAPERGHGGGTGPARPRRCWVGPLKSGAAALTALVLLAPALPVSALAMANPSIAPEEAADLRPLYAHAPETFRITEEVAVARYLDRMHLAAGSVLLDADAGFAIVLNSDNPHQFVITPDYDFESDLADPRAAGVRYMLVPRRGGVGSADALNRAYPSLYATGAGFATLVHDFSDPSLGSSDLGWRLYRVVGSPGS